MSNYPNNFDNDLTLPPAYFEETVSTLRFSCEINPNSSNTLKDPTTGSSFILPPNKSTSIRVSCFIVQKDEPMIVGQFVQYIGAHCAINGLVRVNFNESQFSYNPDGFYEITVAASVSSNLDIIINNNSFKKAKAAAVVEYISI